MKPTTLKKTQPAVEVQESSETTPPPGAAGPTPPPGRFRFNRLLAALACVWVGVIVAVWFGLHPLFDIEFPLYPPEITGRIAGALGSFWLDIGLLGLCGLASALLGHRLLFFWPVFQGFEKAIFSLGLGFGLNIMLILGLGLVGGVNRPVAYGLLLVELALLWPWLRRRPVLNPLGFIFQPVQRWWVAAGVWEKTLGVWLLLAALATLLLALAPPLAWDALMYHLEGPRQYIQAGRIEPLPRLGQASYPFGMEMLFTWGLLLHGDGLAQAFSWLFGLLGAGAIFIFARRFFSRLENPRLAGLLAAALYLSIPHVWLLMTWAYTDLLLAFYALLALYALLLAFERPLDNRWTARYAILGGIMAGLACTAKYTALTAGFGVLVAALAYGGLQKPRPAWRTTGLVVIGFGGAAALSFAPWLLRNIFFSGNPVAPLFGGIRGWDAEEIGFLNGSGGQVSLDLGVVLGRPFEMALLGRDNGLYDATISPLFLALLPLGIRAAWRERAVAALWLAVGLTYLGWLAGISLSSAADHTRLLLPVFPWLALITAYGLLDFLKVVQAKQAGLLRVIAPLVTGLFIAASGFLLLLFFVANDPLPYHFGLQTRQARLEDQLGSYERAVNYVNNQLLAQAKLFMFFEPRSYYFERSLSPDHNSGGQFFYYLDNFHTPQAVYTELLKRGATNVLVNDKLLNFLVETPEYRLVDRAKAGRQLLDDLQSQGYFEKVYQEKGEFTIYKLKV
jgi:hypothetical protein